MIPTVEEILDMPGMMVKILATGRLSANQRGQVLEPANTRTDPTPGERVFLHLVQFAWLQSEFVSTPPDPADLVWVRRMALEYST